MKNKKDLFTIIVSILLLVSLLVPYANFGKSSFLFPNLIQQIIEEHEHKIVLYFRYLFFLLPICVIGLLFVENLKSKNNSLNSNGIKIAIISIFGLACIGNWDLYHSDYLLLGFYCSLVSVLFLGTTIINTDKLEKRNFDIFLIIAYILLFLSFFITYCKLNGNAASFFRLTSFYNFDDRSKLILAEEPIWNLIKTLISIPFLAIILIFLEFFNTRKTKLMVLIIKTLLIIVYSSCIVIIILFFNSIKEIHYTLWYGFYIAILSMVYILLSIFGVKLKIGKSIIPNQRDIKPESENTSNLSE